MDTKTRREAAIEELRAYQADLRTKIKQLDAECETVAKAISLLVAPTDDAQGSLPASKAPVGGPQALVFAFLQSNPGKQFRPITIARALVAAGYSPRNTRTWPTQVRNTLKRAVGKGLAVEDQVDGKLAYRATAESETAK